MSWDRQVNSDGDSLADVATRYLGNIAEALERIADYFEREEQRAESAARVSERAVAALDEVNERQRREEARHHPEPPREGPVQ